MHRQSAGSPPIAGANARQPITTLRGWLDHLAARDRLAVIQPGTRLQFELAAIAKRFDGIKAHALSMRTAERTGGASTGAGWSRRPSPPGY